MTQTVQRATSKTTATSVFACNDGIDNDVDGFVDSDDPSCVDGFDETELNACEDGFDNDFDGWTDLEDLSCTDSLTDSEGGIDGVTQCSDGLDNDADGLVDADDPECLTAAVNSEASQCVDGADNDNDGWFDAEDPDCADVFAEVGIIPDGPACNNGVMMVMVLQMLQMVDVPVLLTMTKAIVVLTI